MSLRAGCFFTILAAALTALSYHGFFGRTAGQRIHELRVRTASTKLPDPSAIETNSEWYYLANVSSGLLQFDSLSKKYVPLLAASWKSQSNGVHIFQLKPGIKFNDGSPITPKDIIWSIKRQALLKTADFFPFAEYLVGCDNIKNLLDECEGLKEISPSEIAIHVASLNSSLFLELASPETGVWSADDMDPMTAKLSPTKFSGPYFLSSRDKGSALLKRNTYSPLLAQFPQAPDSIRLKVVPRASMDEAVANGQLDVAIRDYKPFAEKSASTSAVESEATSPMTMIYLFGVGPKPRSALGSDFLDDLWQSNLDPVLRPAETFLPFQGKASLSKAEFIGEMPKRSAKRIRILCLEGFFSKRFLNRIAATGRRVGINVEFVYANREDWFKAFEDESAAKGADFILSSYIASERNPAAQLRLLTDKYPNPPIDLKKAEAYGDSVESRKILKDYQKWLARSERVVPLYFNVILLLHRKDIDVGQRFDNDSEIALWKFSQRVAR